MTPVETLQHIQHRLAGESPAQVVEALAPQLPSAAVIWVRRLPGWDQFHGQFPGQVIAVARLVSQKALQDHCLKLTEDGRVVSRETKAWRDRKPERTFQLRIAGEELSVEFTPDYYPGTDLFSFVGPKPHCLSQTGHWSQFVPRDVVEGVVARKYSPRCTPMRNSRA